MPDPLVNTCVVCDPPTAAQAEYPRRKTDEEAVPLPRRAVATVPLDKAPAFRVVKFAPLKSSIMVEDKGPLILPSVPKIATFPVPAFRPPPMSNDPALVSLTVNVPVMVVLPVAPSVPPIVALRDRKKSRGRVAPD